MKKVIAIVAVALQFTACSPPRVVAMQPNDPVVPQMPPPPKETNTARIAQGKGLFEDNCAKCHKLFKPTDFNQREWGPILTSMQRKAKLDNDQMDLVRDYVFSAATP